jgi:hypothetical protein
MCRYQCRFPRQISSISKLARQCRILYLVHHTAEYVCVYGSIYWYKLRYSIYVLYRGLPAQRAKAPAIIYVYIDTIIQDTGGADSVDTYF